MSKFNTLNELIVTNEPLYVEYRAISDILPLEETVKHAEGAIVSVCDYGILFQHMDIGHGNDFTFIPWHSLLNISYLDMGN